jgi:hypothetical protein
VRPLFPQNVIAVVWDFDKTLSPAYMQRPLFKKYDVDENAFWNEVNDLLPRTLGKASEESPRGALRVNTDTIYLNRILDYVRAGVFPNLSNAILRELGADLEFFSGLPEALERLKGYVASNPEYQKFEIRVEHYVVSTGLREMIMGSRIAPYVDGVWGCEFAEMSPEPTAHRGANAQLSLEAATGSDVISQVAYAIDNTSKTRAIFEIHKGSNKHPVEIDVNSFMRTADRRVPLENMIYIADGPSDTPVFSVVVAGGGKTLAVFAPGDARSFRQANNLQLEGRVHAVGEADYERGSHASLWLEAEIDRIAQRIVESRHRELGEQVGRPARHLTSAVPAARAVEAETVAQAPKPQVEPRIESTASASSSPTVDAVRQTLALQADDAATEAPNPAAPRSIVEAGKSPAARTRRA